MFLAVKQQDNSKIQLWYDKKLYIFAHVLLVITKVFFSTNKWKGVKYFVLASVSLMLPNFTIIYENIAWVFLCWKGSYDTSEHMISSYCFHAVLLTLIPVLRLWNMIILSELSYHFSHQRTVFLLRFTLLACTTRTFSYYDAAAR